MTSPLPAPWPLHWPLVRTRREQRWWRPRMPALCRGEHLGGADDGHDDDDDASPVPR